MTDSNEMDGYPNYAKYIRNKRWFDRDKIMDDKKFRAEYESWLDSLNKEVDDGADTSKRRG